MSKLDICVDVEKVEVEHASRNTLVEVTLNGVDVDDLISEIGEDVIIENINKDLMVSYLESNGYSITEI